MTSTPPAAPSQSPPEAAQSLLSQSSDAVVRATAAVVAEHAEQITARFYARMFAECPALLRVFNQGNQATGEQSRALAASVVAYAVQLIDPVLGFLDAFRGDKIRTYSDVVGHGNAGSLTRP